MPNLMIIRPIHPLPGRQQEALRWLANTEPIRRQAGQISQFVLRNLVDPSDFEFVQIWTDRQAYDRWRDTPERTRLAAERQRYLTHDPSRLYDVIA